MGKTLTEVDLAYLAGLFDSDGAIMASIEQHNGKKFGFRIRVILKITQKNLKVLSWVHKMLKVGYIAQNRTTYDWVVKGQKEAQIVLLQVMKYLKGKDKQAVIAIQILQSTISSQDDLLKIAKLADTLASFNVRSKNRRKNYASKIQESFSRND